MKARGWFGESHRHYLAGKGIKSRYNYMSYQKQYFAGMRPNIQVSQVGEGRYQVKITPNPMFSTKVKTIEMNEEEFQRYTQYQLGKGGSIQDAFPTWPASKRELFLTGMDDDEYKKYVGG